MGQNIPCCTSTSCTKTYSKLLKRMPAVPEEEKTPEEGRCVFPKWCKILKSLSHEDLREVYTFEKRLGFGHFGVVNQVYLNKDPKKKFAVKSISIQSVIPELKLIENELDILTEVDHPNIIKYYETYNDGKYLHIVMELCTGGELFDRIIKQGKFSEAAAASIMGKILSAISYLHKRGICHRDLKPENFIFSSADPDAEIRIIDFGLATRQLKEGQMNDIVGTPYYVAPEVLKGIYTHACDVWSLGVIFYIMLSGKPPFPGETSSEVLGKVTRVPVCFPEKNWHGISSEAKDLITKMLEKNPEARLTSQQCLDHPWFTLFESSPSSQLDVKLFKRLRNFRKPPSRFKQEVLEIVTKFLHPLVAKYYTNNFRALDQNEDGYITVPDLIQSAKENNVEMNEAEAEGLLKILDFDKDGFSISDFVAASMDRAHVCTEEMAKLAFDHFDVQRDGFITILDLIKTFQRGTKMYSDAEIKQILEEVDLNKDGKISFAEFREILLS